LRSAVRRLGTVRLRLCDIISFVATAVVNVRITSHPALSLAFPDLFGGKSSDQMSDIGGKADISGQKPTTSRYGSNALCWLRERP
jgi:hypothetical protein